MPEGCAESPACCEPATAAAGGGSVGAIVLPEIEGDPQDARGKA